MTDYLKHPEIDFVSLAEKYDFSNVEKLEKEHLMAWLLTHERSVSEQRTVIQNVYKYSKGLQEALEHMHLLERMYLKEKYNESNQLINRAMDDAKLLKELTSQFAEIKGNMRERKTIWLYIDIMADFWEEETGREAECTYHPMTETYYGDFYDFILDCAIYTKKDARTIKRILSDRRSKRSEHLDQKG